MTLILKNLKTLRESDSNANSAKSNAVEAQEMYAEQASQVNAQNQTFAMSLLSYFKIILKDAETIRNNANEAKKEVEKLYSEANNLHSRITGTGLRFGNLEELANKDDTLSEIAKAKVGQAKTDSDEVQSKMQKALDDIKSIIADLENMREISMSDIDELGKFI